MTGFPASKATTPLEALDRARALVRRIARATLGSRGEGALHRGYHAVLRRSGRFAPPEDEPTLRMLRLLAKGSATILDIGANTGRYAHDFLRVARAATRLYAFEPNPSALRLLRANLGDDPRVTIFPVALSSVPGRAALSVPLDATGNPVSALSYLGVVSASETTVDVELCVLDSLVSAGEVVLRPPVFVKIDVEGHEPAVLAGAASLPHARTAIYFECQPEHLARAGSHPAALWEGLSATGYEVIGRAAGGFRRYNQAVEGVVNYLALPRGVLPEGEIDAAEIERALSAWLEAVR